MGKPNPDQIHPENLSELIEHIKPLFQLDESIFRQLVLIASNHGSATKAEKTAISKGFLKSAEEKFAFRKMQNIFRNHSIEGKLIIDVEILREFHPWVLDTEGKFDLAEFKLALLTRSFSF